MTGAKRDWRDLPLGLFLAGVAGGALYATRTLPVGTPADMGPGYMPRAVALGLMGFAIFFLVRGVRRAGDAIEAPMLRPILAILAAGAVFAFTAERLGLVLSAAATVMVASLATRESKPVETALFAAVLAGLAALLFVKVLALPVPLWPR